MSLTGKIVVITGASSGLGRSLALQLATRGARVVLAARREDELVELAERCRDRGGEALVVTTDVTHEADVDQLAAAAVARWGGIDAWINNAGVTLFAPLEEGPFAEHRRVIETNVFGAMFGARAALPVFRRQKRGVLVNVGSVLSEVGQPFVPAYVISKHALRGLSEALRTELADEPDIHVCTIYPYAIDTPHFQDGANRIGREAHAMPPTQDPEEVARAIMELIEKPRRERHVPRIAALGLALHWLLPETTEKLLLHALRRFHFGARQRATDGNLYRPADEPAQVHGERGPRVSTVRFAAWAAAELVRISTDAARSRIESWRSTRS